MIYYFDTEPVQYNATSTTQGGKGEATLDDSYIYGYTARYSNTVTTNVRKLYNGTNLVNSLKIGSSTVKKVYVGNTMVYGTNSTTTYYNGYTTLYPNYVYNVKYRGIYTSAVRNSVQECAQYLGASSANIQYGVSFIYEHPNIQHPFFNIDIYLNGNLLSVDADYEVHASGIQFGVNGGKCYAVYNPRNTPMTHISSSDFLFDFDRGEPNCVYIPPNTIMFFHLNSIQMNTGTNGNTGSGYYGGGSNYTNCKVVITTEDIILTMPLDFNGIGTYYGGT